MSAWNQNPLTPTHAKQEREIQNRARLFRIRVVGPQIGSDLQCLGRGSPAATPMRVVKSELRFLDSFHGTRRAERSGSEAESRAPAVGYPNHEHDDVVFRGVG